MKKSTKYAVGLGVAVGLTAWWLLNQRRRKSMPVVEPAKPGTAVVTGASSGIGEAFARELASRGYDLMLVARRRERLEMLATELHKLHQTRVEIFTNDLSEHVEVESLSAQLAGREDLVLLVNNAGFGTTGMFWEVSPEMQSKMSTLHVQAPTRLTRSVLPGMIARKKGAIINVSSITAFTGVSGYVTYGATKAYLKHFSETLELELMGTGVQVQALCPGFTESEFSAAMGQDTASVPSSLWMSAGEVVLHSLNDLQAGKTVSIPGTVNQVMVTVLPIVPKSLLPSIVGGIGIQSEKGGGKKKTFKRRIYRNWDELRTGLFFPMENREEVKRRVRQISPNFRERLMLAVTQVNQCRYCSYVHSRLALEGGVSYEEVQSLLSGKLSDCPESELPAIFYAQHWAEMRGQPEAEARGRMVECYGEEQTEAIEVVLRMIMTGNYVGNTFDYALYRISGGLWGADPG